MLSKRKMAHMSRNLLMVAASAIALMSPAWTAAAQSSDTTEVVIKAQRRTAVQVALAEQRNAEGVASIISGEELRDQPQANLADLLTRLPGISSSSDMARLQAGTGEAQYVSIRGLDNSYNAFSFDGVRMPQTDSSTRAISLNLLSPFSLSAVRIDKAPTAQTDGDAIAGNIDFRTATAFDFRDNMFQVRSYLQTAELAADAGQDHLGYALQIEGAYKSADKRFGMYLSAYTTDKDTAGSSTAMQSDWEKFNINIPGTTRDNEGNLAGVGVQWNFFRNNIKRQGFTANFDLRGDAHDFYWRTTVGEYNILADLDQASLRRELPNANGVFQINPNPSNGRYTADGLRADYGNMAGGYYRTENSDHSLFTTKIGGQSRLNNLTLNYHFAYNKGEQDYPMRAESAFYGIPYIGTPGQTGVAKATIQVDTKDPKNPRAVLTPEAYAYLNDPNNTKQWYVQGGFDEAWEEKNELALTANWEIKNGALTSILGGVKFESSDRFANRIDPGINRFRFPGKPVIGGISYDFTTNNAPFYLPQGAVYATFPGETLTTFMGGAPQVPLRLVDPAVIENQYRTLAIPARPYTVTELSRNQVSGEETRNSYFVQAVLDYGNLKVTPGLRIEDNSFKANYAQRRRVTGQPDAFVRVNSEKSYSQALPSVVAAYRPNDNTVYRGVLRTAYSRPSFDLLFGPDSISYATDGVTPIAINETNPDLKAVESFNLDLSAEYYSRGSDFFTATLFYKDLSDVIFANATTNTEGFFNIASTTQKINGVDVSRLSNEGNGTVLGLEFAANHTLKGLPSYLDGLSVGGNVTFQETEAEVFYGGENRTLMLPNAPEIMYNAEIEYNKNALTMVLNYKYMGLRLLALRSDRSDTYAQPTQRLNFMTTYELSNGLTLGASVENLLDDHSYWATAGKGETYLTNDRRGGYVKAGRVFMLSLSYRR